MSADTAVNTSVDTAKRPEQAATLVWLQREFRLSALPALQAALDSAGGVIVAYFHDPKQQVGEANSLWLAHSLVLLQKNMRAKGGDLWVVDGDFATQFSKLLSDYKVRQVMYSFQVGTPFMQMQQQALAICQQYKVALTPFYSEFLLEPQAISNQQNKPYLVFTPFYKALMAKQQYIEPLQEDIGCLTRCAQIQPTDQAWLDLPADLQALAREPWAKKMMSHWQVGEQAAWQKLDEFIKQGIDSYDYDRDFPSLNATSGLSQYLHFGEINPRVIYYYLQALMAENLVKAEQAMPWIRQLVWKEFARHLLVHFPQTETEPFQSKYKTMAWQEDLPNYQAWQKGLTGIPIVDAGMRELWETGTMHNRVRMLVASFLTKNLNQSWLKGKAWFDNTLFDADPANNVMGWQWVAGCGVDASPYYRLFNPVTQSVKFDDDGEYIRTWVPELKLLSSKAIHAPWEYLAECKLKGIELGTDYPYPLVDLKQSRTEHLERVAAIKAAS
ncbi:deoxyribodipyrimidine photo-lyase [Thiomicrorhabdus immobilis]|uniref:Deoxyribodipyrimidine photo-lyase n=1 Tax=Thiomicrorhabdus immobilis TaxID=2791037 RepID=A0ABN6CZC1_9GAMM|nr:deoxyribodipyrimidine photo-lyase [Thiomicrorhabdus immobilis]BCN94355.1 deoxyribodipyrimidine photo-lyase [Thiomicrorhabdus immobilis]